MLGALLCCRGVKGVSFPLCVYVCVGVRGGGGLGFHWIFVKDFCIQNETFSLKEYLMSDCGNLLSSINGFKKI